MKEMKKKRLIYGVLQQIKENPEASYE